MKNTVYSLLSVGALAFTPIACAAEEAQPQEAAAEAPATPKSSFNFSIPGDDTASNDAAAGFNFNIPADDVVEGESETALGKVEIPVDDSSQVKTFESELKADVE